MNRSEIIFSLIRIPVDFFCILLAGILSYQLRISNIATEVRPILYNLDVNWYLWFVTAFAFGVISIMALAGMYKMKVNRGLMREIYQIFSSVSTTVLIIILYYFFYSRDVFSSRFLMISLWGLAILTLIVGRLSVRLLQNILIRKYQWGNRKIALITGNGNIGQIIASALFQAQIPGYSVIYNQSKVDIDQLKHLAISKQIEEIIIADTDISQDDLITVNYICEEYKLDFQYVPNILDLHIQVETRNLGGILLFRVKRTPLEGWGHVWKRLFDILVSLLAILILLPVYILTIIAIKLDSPGPVLYKSKRVGLGNKEFNVYKFRSMYQDLCTDEKNPESLALEEKLLKAKGTKSGPVNKIQDDPRITPLGKFIRQTSIDELPQFFNVLAGSMSLVGPRPHQPREVQKYEQHHKKVLTIKPGLTGMAQVNGRSDLSFEEEVLYDTFYIENWSLWLDIIIICKTPWAMIAPRKAL